MNQHVSIGIFFQFIQYHLSINFVMYATVSIPNFHFPSGDLLYISTQIFVRERKVSFFFRQALYDFQGIGRRAAIVRVSLYFSRGVHVTDNEPSGFAFSILSSHTRLLPRLKSNRLLPQGISTFLLGEMMDAVSAMKCTPQKTIISASGGSGHLGKSQGVTQIVGNVLHFRTSIVVRQNDGVFSFLSCFILSIISVCVITLFLRLQRYNNFRF